MNASLEDPNLVALLQIAEQLGPLRDEVVFVGGATVALLITDPGAPSVRVTDDVDCIVEVATLTKYHDLTTQLREQGFEPDPTGPICRFRLGELKLDVMPSDPSILGFANRWAGEAMSNSVDRVLGEIPIRLIAAPYFIGTKLEAFRGRGGGDLFASHDIEDLIAVVDGRPSIVEEVRGSGDELKEYLASALTPLVTSDAFEDVVAAHLPPDAASQERGTLVCERLRVLASVDS